MHVKAGHSFNTPTLPKIDESLSLLKQEIWSLYAQVVMKLHDFCNLWSTPHRIMWLMS